LLFGEKYRDFFGSGLIVPSDMPIGEKYEDFFWSGCHCFRRLVHWWKIQNNFYSDLIILGNLPIGEKYEDFSKVV